MGTARFTPEFKEEAVKQVTERGYGVADVASRLGA
jgi:transposase